MSSRKRRTPRKVMKHMATMQAMGFEEDACRSALEACGGDVGQAIETLCSQQKRLEAFNESPKAEVVDGKTIYISGNETLVIDGDESDDEDPSFEHSSTVYDANGTAMSPLTREMANAMAEGIENAAIEFKKSMELQNMVTLYDEVTSSDHGSEGEAKGSRLEGEEDADASSESSPQGDVEEILESASSSSSPSSSSSIVRSDPSSPFLGERFSGQTCNQPGISASCYGKTLHNLKTSLRFGQHNGCLCEDMMDKWNQCIKWREGKKKLNKSLTWTEHLPCELEFRPNQLTEIHFLHFVNFISTRYCPRDKRDFKTNPYTEFWFNKTKAELERRRVEHGMPLTFQSQGGKFQHGNVKQRKCK